MIRVLIVDDEQHVRRAIRRMIDWQQMGMEAMEADNGEAALAVAAQFHPHIVILDMQMPLMDGSALMGCMAGHACEFIVVSGHNDYHYMKNAIVHQAVDYLLKSISRKEINDAVTKALKAIEAKTDRESRTVVAGHLKRLLWKEPRMMSAGHQQAILAADPSGWEKLALICCYLMDFQQIAHRYYNDDSQLLKYHVTQALRRLFPDMDNTHILYGMGGLADPVIVHKHPLRYSTFPAVHFDLELEEGIFAACTVFENPAIIGIKDLRQAYTRMRSQFLEQSWNPTAHAAPNSRMPASPGSEPGYEFALLRRIQREIVPCVHQGDLPSILGKLHEWITQIQELSELTITQTYHCYMEMRQAIHACMDSIEAPALTPVSIDDFLAFGLQPGSLLENLADENEQIQNRKRSHKPQSGIEQVRRFLQDNYSQPYSLDHLASRFHLSRSYLCKAFKEKYGSTITDYVIRLRMEKARTCMVEQGYPVQQASEIVGMTDYSYFSKLYKKHYGYPPSNEAR